MSSLQLLALSTNIIEHASLPDLLEIEKVLLNSLQNRRHTQQTVAHSFFPDLYLSPSEHWRRMTYNFFTNTNNVRIIWTFDGTEPDSAIVDNGVLHKGNSAKEIALKMGLTLEVHRIIVAGFDCVNFASTH